MIFSVYMRRRYRCDIALLAKKQRCPKKNTSKGDISEKDDIHPRFILDSSYLCWYTTFIDTRERAKEAATGNVFQEKVFLEILQNCQVNICARASFLIKLQT